MVPLWWWAVRFPVHSTCWWATWLRIPTLDGQLMANQETYTITLHTFVDCSECIRFEGQMIIVYMSNICVGGAGGLWRCGRCLRGNLRIWFCMTKFYVMKMLRYKRNRHKTAKRSYSRSISVNWDRKWSQDIRRHEITRLEIGECFRRINRFQRASASNRTMFVDFTWKTSADVLCNIFLHTRPMESKLNSLVGIVLAKVCTEFRWMISLNDKSLCFHLPSFPVSCFLHITHYTIDDLAGVFVLQMFI